VLSLVLLGSIGGRLLMGVLADLFPKKFVMLGIYGLVALTVRCSTRRRRSGRCAWPPSRSASASAATT
jgi:hypothetical protein